LLNLLISKVIIMLDVKNSLLMKALRQEPIHRTPVWLMRQAGRYLPEYRKTRQQAGDFLSLCKNTELACEVALQPLRRFTLDAAILFSDILTIPDAMGLGLYFAEGEGPCFQRPLHSIAAIETLAIPDIKAELAYVFDAVNLIRREMPATLPLIGFSGSPWTLACYMVEGRSSANFQRLRQLLVTTPEIVHLLLMKLTKAVSEYLSQQIQAGADLVMLFDTWGGLLATDDYLDFSLQYMQLIVDTIKKKHADVPVILFTKGGGNWLAPLSQTGCDALGLDWTCDLAWARQQVGQQVALQGNFAPSLLLTDKLTIEHEVKRILNAYGKGSGHIFNLGHGITPEVPIEHVHAMLDALHRYSPAFHTDD
jgi:uroporphyrinogen decarboxylase